MAEAREALLANAGADQAEPGIRALVDLENAQLLALNQGFLQQLLAFQRPSTVINPVEEAERLRAAPWRQWRWRRAIPCPIASA